MFTGLVSDVGTVRKVEQRGDLRLEIATAYPLSEVALGASIACSGVCLTVVDKGTGENGDWFAVDVSAETASRTGADLWREGARINLERALRIGDELGGHLVTGHVDVVGEVVGVQSDGDSNRLTIAVPATISPLIAAKGSITLDGVSLTVNEVTDTATGGAEFTVNIIPHTAANTTFGDIAPGRQLNVEIDVIARYLQRMIATKSH